VHHAVNDRYLDKNYGGILLVWDRLFGTYAPEDPREPCVYGTRSPLQSWNPLWANLQVYRDLAFDSWRAKSWADKLRVWLKPPGWRPADVAAKWPRPGFDLQRFVRAGRYDPRITEQAAWVAGTLFAVVLLLTTLFLWNAHRLAPWLGLGLAGLILVLLWAVGHATEPAVDVTGGGDAGSDSAEAAADTVPHGAHRPSRPAPLS